MTTAEVQKQTLRFQAEEKQLLHLVIHHLYSNKEIFLRELISNASDAEDKLAFEAIKNPDLYENDHELKIRVSFDKDAHTITISDNGVGMSRDEVIAHLGTIAKSGTRDFLAQLTGDQAKDAKLIGQFGVGFYSAFIVADKVTVITRRAGLSTEQGVVWESTGEGEYTIEASTKAERGTDVILHIKKDEEEFLNDWRLRHIISKYSDHISRPIVMLKSVEQAEEGKEQQAEEETVNRATALWTLPKSEIKDSDYQALYKHISHDFEEPLIWSHNKVEGKQEYISLLFIPARAPYDMWNREKSHGLKLFVRRVFIMDDAEQFLPLYLRFVKGIVDSNDLPLNISREILQSNKTIDAMKSALTKRVLGMLEKLASDDKEKYEKFWGQFGQVLKEGPGEDYANREEIAKLLRFASTHLDTPQQSVSLEDYLSRMKPGQEKIYFITADTFTAAQHSPHLEIFRKKGIEVLILTDRVDEWLVAHLPEFQGKALQSVAKGDLDLGQLEDEEDKKKAKETEQEMSGFIEQIKKVLDDKVKEVRITHRLTQSPSCIVADENDLGGQMQRIMKAAGQVFPEIKPILEINPEHALINRLKDETDDSRFNEWVHILFDQAILAEGGQLADPAQFVQRINQFLLEAR